MNANGLSTEVGYEWGTTPDTPNFTGYIQSATGDTVQEREFSLSGLTFGTTYYFRIRAQNAGNSVPQRGAVLAFTTAPVETAPASAISFTKATLQGRINPLGIPRTVHFEYGFSAELGSSTGSQKIPAGAEVVEFTQELTGLASNTAVYFRAVASDPSGLQRGTVQSFQTRAPLAPLVESAGTADLAARSAGLVGTVTSNGLATSTSFEYGLTAAYGSVAAASVFGPEDAAAPMEVTVQGLAPHTTYHFRAKAENSMGAVVGEDKVFTTLNTPPVAQSRTMHIPLQGLASIELTATDFDADGDDLTLIGTSGGEHGVLAIHEGKLRYQPSADFTGNDAFTYTISDGFGGTSTATVTLRNDAPVAVDDVVHPRSSVVVVDVLTLGLGDSDPDGDELVLTAVTQGAYGAVAIQGRQVIYTAGQGYEGNDTFTYTISDQHGGSSTGRVELRNSLPIAAPDQVVSDGDPVRFDPRENDADGDGDPLQLVSVTQGAVGSVTFQEGSDVITYTPGPGYFGRDAFSYRVSDGNTQASGTVVVRSSVPILRVSPAVKGAPVPGQPMGTTYADLGTPTEGAFSGKIQAGKGPKVPVVFAADGTVLLKVGDPAPGVPGAVIVALQHPTGQAVIASLKGGEAAAKSYQVLYTGLTNGTVQIAAREGDILAAGVELKRFGAVDGNGADVFFIARLGGASVRRENDTALIAAAADGTLKVLARKGDLVDGRKVKTLGTLIGSAGTLGEERWRTGDHSIGVRISFSDGGQTIYDIPTAASSSADWTQWAKTGDSLAISTTNTSAHSFGLPGFAPGMVAFTANLPGESAGKQRSRKEHALFSVTLEGSALVARQGQPALGYDGVNLPGLTFNSFSDPVAGGLGRTAFAATLTGAATAGNNRGVWLADEDGLLLLIARTGDPAPGGGRWAALSSLAFPNGPESGPLILGRLAISAADGITKHNHQGLWGVDRSGALRLLLRTGQNLTVGNEEKVVRSFVTLGMPLSPSGTALSYDNDRHVTALVTFQDRTRALVRIAIP